MKHIFLIFWLVLWSGMVFADENSQEKQGYNRTVSEQTPYQDSSAFTDLMQDLVTKFYLPMRTWTQQVRQIDPQQTDIKAVNPLTALYLATSTDVNLLTGTRGYTEWQIYPFGRMRLVSCRAGLKQDMPVFMGLQAQIHPDWALYKPDIILNTPSRETVISYPLSLKLPEGITRTFLYEKDVVFPIFFMPKSFDKPIDAEVTVKWRALNPYVRKDISDTADFQMPLTLEDAYETGICPYMTSFLSVSPAPARDNVKISATLNEAQDIQLFFEFKKETKTLHIQIDDAWTFTQDKKTLNGKTATLIITPSQTLKAGDILPLKVITSFGVFDVPTLLKKGDFYHDKPDFSWGGVIVNGIWLFLLTPLFSYFLLRTKQTARQLKQDARQTLIVISSVGLMWTMAWQAGLFLPIDLTQYSFTVVWITVLILLWWMIGVRLSLGLMGILIIFLPKPYLMDSVGLTAYYPYTPLIAGCLWTALVSWPFVWVYRYPDAFLALHTFMRQDKRSLLWLARVPALAVLVWLGIGGGIVSFTKSYESYSLTALEQAVAADKVVFVSLRNPICLSCTLMQTSIELSCEAKDLKKEQKLVRMILSSDSFEAKELMKRYGKVSAPMNLLYGPKYPDGILLPTYVDYAGFSRYLNIVK